MRKLIVCLLTSLDGYVSGDGDDFMVMPLDHSFSEYNATRMRSAETILLGATTFRGFVSHWPSIEDDESQPPIEREISSINNRIQKVVVSDSLTPEDTGVWRDSTESGRARSVAASRPSWRRTAARRSTASSPSPRHASWRGRRTSSWPTPSTEQVRRALMGGAKKKREPP